jgi:hypothetical protein
MSNQPLVDAVKNWVHFDNLCINLAKQMTTARNLKNNFETQILSQLGKVKRLRIKDAYLEPVSKTISVPLNWTGLEETLHQYYAEKKRTDETGEIIEFLKNNRNQKTTVVLKKMLLEDGALKQNTITD